MRPKAPPTPHHHTSDIELNELTEEDTRSLHGVFSVYGRLRWPLSGSISTLPDNLANTSNLLCQEN